MRTIYKFEKYSQMQMMGEEWTNSLPKKLSIVDKTTNKVRHFKLGNVDRHANMTQVAYVADVSIFGLPDEISIDIYFYKKFDRNKLSFDLMYGDFMECEFSIVDTDKVKIIKPLTAKDFSLSRLSIESLCDFINSLSDFHVELDQLIFLHDGNIKNL